MSKPSTPVRRRSQRSSGAFNILAQSPSIHYPVDPENLPLESAPNIEKFEKLSDALEELEVNMMGLNRIQSSLATEFNESFASFLYGLSMTMWCVHFPGRPSKDQWEKVRLIDGLDARIEELKRKLQVSRQENDKLKKKLQEKPVSKKRPLLNPDEDRVSKIPVRRNQDPNLNQSPRYMRGLFEKKKPSRPPFKQS